ncbi:MAG: PKD domain-containing protein, partial [Bacteroidota bacterium]
NLFTFQNTGTCSSDSIYLMQNDDPFFPPNSQSANVGQQLTVAGYGGADVPVCIAGTGAVACQSVPPAEPDCIATYVLEELPGGDFQVSMISDTTWTAPNNIVSSAQWTVKVPAGGFVPANLTSLIPGVSFSLASTYDAPSEDPSHDYISIILASPGTTLITFTKDQKVPLFTFTNDGTCQGDPVFLMDNETDPFFPPNSQSANVGQQLTVLGFGGADAPVCVQNLLADDCSPCGTITAGEDKIICPGGSALIELGSVAGTIEWSPTTGLSCTDCPNPTANPSVTTTYTVVVVDSNGCVMTDDLDVIVSIGATPGFSAVDGCEGIAVNFNDTTTSTDAIISWNWDFGDGTASSSQQHPTHIFSNSGNFEVSLTVTTGGGCNATISDFVTVFPSPGELPQDNFGICNGEGVTLQTPAALTSASWSPSTGLDDPNSLAPVATPSATTTYTVTLTNANGCTNQDQATVTVTNKPIIQDVVVIGASDCDAQSGGGSIIVTASGVAALEFSIDNGQTWQASNIFSNLSPGSNYVVLVRLESDLCPVAYNGNPVTIGSAAAANISNVSFTHPSDCATDDGTITITASGGIAPIQFSIDGGTTWQASNFFENLGGGTYQIRVSNADGSCVISDDDVVLNQPAPPTILTPVNDFTMCEGFTAQVSIQLSEDIQSQIITGQGSISFLT